MDIDRMIAMVKSRLRALLPKNAFARGVGVLVGGTASAQLLLIVAAPLLTRLYSPEDFGLLAVYASLLGLICVIASLRYELAIPLPESDQEAANVVVLSLLFVVGMTILSAVIIFFFGQGIIAALGVPALASYIWLLPLGVLLSGTFTVFNYWSIRTKRFTTIAGTKLRQAIATLVIQLTFFKLGGIALLLGQVAGQSVGTASLARPALALPVFKSISWRGIAQAAKRYRRFPIYSTWGAAFNTTSAQLPLLLLASLFSTTAAGLYMLAHRVLAMPMSLVGSAIANVFFSNATDAWRNGNLGPLVASIHDKLAHIAMPPAILLVVAGPELFSLVFGADWKVAGEFARWMAPWLYLQFITSPLTMLFPVLEKQIHEVIFQGILLASRLAALLIGAWYGDLMTAVILFSLSSAVCYLGLLMWEVRVSGNEWTVVYSSSMRALIISGLAVCPLIMAQWLGMTTWYWLGALVLTVFIVAFRYVYLARVAW